MEVGQLVADLVHRPQHPLKADQLAAQGEQTTDFLAVEERVEGALLGFEHFFLHRFDDREIPVDDEVEDGVEHIVDAVLEQPGRGFELVAKPRVGALGAVAHADDEGLADEHRRFAIGDAIVGEMRRSRDDEQLVPVDVDLGQLMRGQRILDGQRMEVVVLLQPAQLGFARLKKSDPDEFGTVGRAGDGLIERDRADQFSVAVKAGGDDAHATDPLARRIERDSV